MPKHTTSSVSNSTPNATSSVPSSTTTTSSVSPKSSHATSSVPSHKSLSLRLLHLYPNMMDLYGDSGNLQILRYRAEQRGIKLTIDSYAIGDPAPDFSNYDLIFLGGGSDKEQKVVARDIQNFRAALAAAHRAGVFFLLICGGFQLFGDYYKDSTGTRIPGLKFYDYYTESSTDKRQRCIGNIVIRAKFAGHHHRIVGFENHGGQTHGVTQPFGEVLVGNGNTFASPAKSSASARPATNSNSARPASARSARPASARLPHSASSSNSASPTRPAPSASPAEGLFDHNFLGTYLHGPLLSKNPALADYLLTTCLERKTNQKILLPPLDDSFETHARREMLSKLL